MNTLTNSLQTYLGHKMGAGISARIDETGNHILSQQVIDAYATSGQAVPQEINNALRELNEIAQSEFYMSNASQGARAMASGTGYDAVKIRNRVGELEHFILQNSAEARTAVERTELQRQQQQVRSLELANDFNARTMSARVMQTRAAASLAQTQAEQARTIEERGENLRQASQYLQSNNLTMSELMEAADSSDPAILNEVFGTDDRQTINSVLTALHTQEDQRTQIRTQALARTVARGATDLAGNENYTTEDLQNMLSGRLAIPEDISRSMVEGAVEQRLQAMQNRANLTAMETQLMQQEVVGIEQQQQLQETLVRSLTLNDQAAVLADVLGMPGQGITVRDMLMEGDHVQILEQLGELDRQGVRVPVEMPSRQVVEVSPSIFAASIADRTAAIQAGAADQIMTSFQGQNFQRNLQRAEQEIRTAESMLGIPLPRQVNGEIEAQLGAAHTLFQQSLMETNPQRRQDMQSTAHQIIQEARETVALRAEQSGVSDVLIEDIRQGRFSSAESWKSRLISATGFGEGGFQGIQTPGGRTNHPIANRIGQILREAEISPQAYQEWASDPDAGFDELPNNVANQLRQAVFDGAYEFAATAVIANVQEMPAFEQLPPAVQHNFQTVVDNLFNPEDGRAVSPIDALARLGGILQVMDEQAYLQDREAARAAGEPPSYQRGSFIRQLDQQLSNENLIENFIAPGGKLDPAMAVFITEATAGITGMARFGEGAAQFEDLPAIGSSAIVQSMNSSLAGQTYASMARVRQLTTSAATRMIRREDEWMTLSTGEIHEMPPELESQVQIAMLQAYQKRLADPARYQVHVFGLNTGIGGGPQSVSREDVIQELNNLGYTDAVQWFITAEDGEQ